MLQLGMLPVGLQVLAVHEFVPVGVPTVGVLVPQDGGGGRGARLPVGPCAGTAVNA